MTEDRPDPDTLLAEVKGQEARQRRGKLKVFFGMSAGVGKTYAMLEEARKRAAEEVDVLIGYAEPHIRPDTESLLLGMELLPHRTVEYRGATLKEFDLDAALSRHPTIICVDELAHTNVPGMRHPKRWQDVDELLAAGISVYTTLNVQHLESYNDIVQRITGVRVQETLPDSVLEAADEVELVDIAPEELLERLREGKVYTPDQVERATRHFFTKGNLIALRELALRKTAERVDAQMQDYRRDQRVRQVIPASERVLVCVGPSPLSARLVRSARHLAAGMRAQLIAVTVETPASARADEATRQRVEANLRLAEELGAQTAILSGQNIADELIEYAQAHNVTKIVVGKPVRSRWHDMLLGSIVDDLVRRSGGIDIYVIRGETVPGERPPRPQQPPQRRWDWAGYAWAVGIVAFTTAVGWPLYNLPQLHVNNVNILMLYLVGVLWVATHRSRGAAVLASILSVAAFDVTFVEPYYTFAVTDQQYIVTFVVMLLTALTLSEMTFRVRAQIAAARHRERRTAALLAISRDLSKAHEISQIIAATERHVGETIGDRASVLLAAPDGRLVAAGSAGAAAPDAKEMVVAQWAFEHDQPAGHGTTTLPAATGTYVPLHAPRGVVGVLVLVPGDGAAPFSGERRAMVEALVSQSALAIERAQLAEEARSAWERAEAELLRNTLLSGVSHDLRTPLAAITGAASSLIETGSKLSQDSRMEMLDTIYSQAQRMERLVNNLLDMTRLESGGLNLNRDWQHLQEVVGAVLRNMKSRLRGRRITTAIPADLPLVLIDDVAIEQVLNNLLDNAIEYTPPDSQIMISAGAQAQQVVIEIADHGPGLPAGVEKRVFEKFFRASSGQAGQHGIGLGLAICKGIIEAHGGTISAFNRGQGGAVFRITLSSGPQPAVETHGAAMESA